MEEKLVLNVPKEIKITIGTNENTGGTTDHSAMNNLDFENSGHTGFQKELTIDSEPVAGSTNPISSDYVYGLVQQYDSQFTDFYYNKADNVTVVYVNNGDTVMLNHNYDIRAGKVEALMIRVPQDIGDIYECMMSITASENGMSLYVLPQYNDYSEDNIVWTGDDVDANGAFFPQAGTSYEISFRLVSAGNIVARVGAF